MPPSVLPVDPQHLAYLDVSQACNDCARACRRCLDGCIQEPAGHDLAPCIRADLDCAAICDATALVLAHTFSPNQVVVAKLLEACEAACAACADACGMHGGVMDHCRICAEACRACEAACRGLAASLVSV